MNAISRPSHWLSLIVVLALIAGCGLRSSSETTGAAVSGGDATTAPPTALPAPVFETTAVPQVAPTLAPPAVPTVTPIAAAVATAAPLPTPAQMADADATWLRVNGFGPGNFGDPIGVLEGSVSAFFGPPVEQFNMSECGAGPLRSLNWDDFSLLFQEEQFVGWFYTTSAPVLTSPSLVTPGITRAQLEQVYVGVDIGESTLGQEFFFEVPAGYMGGFLTPDGQRVTDMYAGTTCFFR